MNLLILLIYFRVHSKIATPHDSLFANITNYQNEVNTFYYNISTLRQI